MLQTHQIMVYEAEYSIGARAEVRARQNEFYHRILHKIFYFPNTLNTFIFFKLVAVDAFEIHVFS